MKTVMAVFVLAVGLSNCSSPSSEVAKPVGVGAPVFLATPGERAVERFLITWNSRDPDQWAGSLHFPHSRPSVGGSRLWLARAEYVETVDYDRVLATGWDHTEYEDLRSVHAGDRKAHIAGRWARFDAVGNVIQRNLVTYVATERNGKWGIQARFGAGPPVAPEQAGHVSTVAVSKVEEFMEAFNARDVSAWAGTLSYPHVRVASDDVVVWDTEAEFVEAHTGHFERFSERFDWARSEWDAIEVVQVSENAANVGLTFSRYNAEGDVTSTFNTLYLVTNDDGRWGIRARSSFAP